MGSKHLRLWFLCVSLPALAGAGLPIRAEAKPPQRISAVIPFTPWRGHGGPLVEIRFSDTVTGTFLVDTGATDCMITDTLAKKLGLKETPVRDAAGREVPSDARRSLRFVVAKQIQIGPLALKDASFLVLDKGDLPASSSEQAIDGLLGTTLLAQFALILDAPQRRLVLISPGGLSEEEIGQMGFDAERALPLDKQERVHADAYDPSGSYRATVELRNGERRAREKFVIDTGASGVSISYDTARKLGLSALQKQGASTFYGSFITNVARVPAVALGEKLVLTDCPVQYPGNNDKIIEPLLGEDVFAYCVSLFDLVRDKLYLKPVLPPLASGALPAPDPQRVNRERLREAAELPPVELVETRPATGGAGEEGDAGDVPARIEALLGAMRGDAGDAARAAHLGRLYAGENEREKSREFFARAAALYREQLKARPDDVLLLCALADALENSDQEAEAETTARRAAALAPAEPKTWIALGWALHARSLRTLTGGEDNATPDITEDLAAYQARLARLRANPPDAAALNTIRELSRQARECFDKAVALAPRNPETYAARAAFITDAGLGIGAPLKEMAGGAEVNPAAEMFPPDYLPDIEQIARLRPDDPDALRQVAQANVEVPVSRNEKGLDFRAARFFHSLPRRHRQAVEEIAERLAGLGKGTDKARAAKALEALGVVQSAAERNDALAETTLRHAVALDPAHTPRAVHALARILTREGRDSDLADLLTARIAAADTVQTRILLARTLGTLGQWEQAGAHVEAALGMRPDDFLSNLAMAAFLLRHGGDDPGALTRAGRCLLKAQQAMGNAPGASRRTRFTLLHAIYLGLTGDPGQAQRKMEEILRRDRSNTEAREVLAALYF